MNALKAQLKYFGLNPSQWTLRPAKEKIFVIHRDDPNLKFVGTFNLNKLSRIPQWQNLVLLEN